MSEEMTDIELIELIASTLEDFHSVYVDGDDIHMSAWHDDGLPDFPWVTDDNRAFETTKGAAIYIKRVVGDVKQVAEDEYSAE